MTTAISLFWNVLITENTAGKYFAFYAAALILLLMFVKGKEINWIRYSGAFLILVCNPFSLFVYTKLFPEYADGSEVVFALPLVAGIAFLAVWATFRQNDKEKRRLIWIGCLIVFLLSSAILPYHGDAVILRDREDKSIVMAIGAAEKAAETMKEMPIVLAPDAVVEKTIAYADNLTLLYGKDLWMSDSNRAVADTYPMEYISLHNKMQMDYLLPDEIAMLAEQYHCNILILRAKLTEGGYASDKWHEAASVPGYVVYVRNM